MTYQLCMRDEYGQGSILLTNEDLDEVIKRCKREVNAVNVDNALTIADKKRNWESYMVEIDGEYTYAGKDGRGVDQVFDSSGTTMKLSEVDVELKMYCGTLDGEDWYASVPSRTVRGKEDEVTALTHETLQGKNVYFIKLV